MGWLVFVAGAVLSWGAYGVLLHRGQVLLGNPLKALLRPIVLLAILVQDSQIQQWSDERGRL